MREQRGYWRPAISENQAESLHLSRLTRGSEVIRSQRSWRRAPGAWHVSLSEIAALRDELGLPVERDLCFQAKKTLSAYADEAKRLGADPGMRCAPAKQHHIISVRGLRGFRLT